MCKFLQNKKVWFAGILSGMFFIIWAFTTLTPNGLDDYLYFYVYGTEQRVASFGDIFTSMVTHWNIWGGRVMAHILVQFFLWMPKALFNVANALVYVLFVYLVYRFIQTGRKEISIKLLLGIVCALWLFLPAFGENILWLTGSCNYLWGLTIILAWLLQFKQHLDTPKQRSVGYTIAFTLLSVPMGAFSENSSAAAMLMAGLMMLYMLYKKIKWQLWMITSLVAAFAGWLFLIFAPGNAARADGEEVGWSFFAKCYNRVVTAAQVWQINMLPMLVLFAVLLVIAIHLKAQPKQIHLSLMLVFTAFACNFAMTLSPTYPLRACMGTFLFLLLACGVLFQSIQADWFILLAKCALAAAVMFAMSDVLVSGKEVLQCYTLVQDREEFILESVAAGELDIEMYNVVTDNEKSIYSTQVGWFYAEDSRFNEAFARYYGLDSMYATYDVYYGQEIDE